MFVTVTLNPALDRTLTVTPALTPGGVHQVTAETVTPGGKGINVAKVLAALGRKPLALGLVGTGDLPLFKSWLEKRGIATHFMPVPAVTRTNLMVRDGGGGEMKFNRPGFPGMRAPRRGLRRYLLDRTRPDDVVILSGSLPAGWPASTYAGLIRALADAGRITVLDTSGRALQLGAAAGADVIKPNRAELGDILGRPIVNRRDMRTAVAGLARRHLAVIASDGRHGAWFAAGGNIHCARPPKVTAVDTTAAGDSLLGAFCAGFFPGRVIQPQTIALALAAGAAAVEQSGTPMLKAGRIRQLAGQTSSG